MANNDRNEGTGTSIPGSGTGTSIPGASTAIPDAGTGTSIPGTGTAIPGAGTGTAIPGAGTGTAIPGNGTGTMAADPRQATQRIGSIADIPLLDQYVISGIKYTVNKNMSARTLSNKSGEARILVVENGGRTFALKLYIPNHGPDHKVLDKVQQAKGGFLVKLHDHGKWTDSSTGKVFDYEIMDYLSYGSLADIMLRGDEAQFRDIAMRMAFAIRQSHQQGLIHRDVKPENFMFTDAQKKNFVLIDFGIARTTDGTNPVKVDAAKSSYFVSPEGSISSTDRTTYVGPPTDYYSMGMTLLALLMGVSNFYKIYPVNDLSRLDLHKRNNQVVNEARRNGLKISDNIAELLEALLEVSDAKRAGFTEVEKWFKGESIRRNDITDSGAGAPGFKVIFNEVKNQIARSPEELARMMMADVEFAKKFLYRGLAKSALQGIRPTLAIEIDDLTQTAYPRSDEQASGVYAAALLLDQSMAYIGLNGKQKKTIDEIVKEIWDNIDEYSKRLSNRNDNLWIYVRMRGDNKLKALEKTIVPMVKSSGIHGVYALVLALDPNRPYTNFKTRKTVNTVEKMAVEVWENKEQYVQELKNKDHSFYTWLRNKGMKDDFINKCVNGVTNNGEDGIYAIALALDKNFPLYSTKGKPLKTMDDVANEIHDAYIGDAKTFTNSNHPLWQWLRSMGGDWKVIGDTYPGLIKEVGGNVYIWDLYYRIGTKRKPYSIQHVDDNKWYYVYSLDELITAAREHGITTMSFNNMTYAHFTTWLSMNDCKDDARLAPVMEKMVKEAGSSAHNRGYEFIYRLRPDVSMNFYTDKKDKKYIGTAEQIGTSLNEELNSGISTIKAKGGKSLVEMLNNRTEYKKSQLYQYLVARNMSSYATGIEKMLDVQGNINAHPAAPYTWDTAVWKIVQYLGATPRYKFRNCGITNEGYAVSTADVSKQTSATLKAQPTKDIYNFIALFYHENVKGSYSFQKLHDYYKFIKSEFPGSTVASRGTDAEDKVYYSIRKRDKAWDGLKKSRKIAMWVCLPIMILVVILMCGLIISDGAGVVADAITSIGTVVAVILAIIGFFLGAEGGLIGMVVCAALGFGLGKLIFWILSAIAPYLVVAAIVGAAIWAALKLRNATQDAFIPNKSTYDNLITQADIYVVTKAFDTYSRTMGSQNTDPSTIFNDSAALAATHKSKARKALWAMIITTIVSILVGILITHRTATIVEEENAVGMVIPVENISGTYTGKFSDRQAELTLKAGDLEDYTYPLEGDIYVKYNTPMRQHLTGYYYTQTGEFILNATEKGSTDDLIYSGKAWQDGNEVIYEGIYQNTTKGKKHVFRFVHTVTPTKNVSPATGNVSKNIEEKKTTPQPAEQIEKQSEPQEAAVNRESKQASQEVAEQENTPPTLNTMTREAPTITDPQFPGGNAALSQWLSSNLRYPAQALDDGVKGRVVVEFTITSTGAISNAHVIRSVHPDLDKEALRVINAMPNWIPGTANGEPASVKHSLPITFTY